jgi:hypothetical protein
MRLGRFDSDHSFTHFPCSVVPAELRGKAG